MSKLAYIVSDIKQYVHVAIDKEHALLMRVKTSYTRKGKRKTFNPVLYSKCCPEGGRPFWVETPFIRYSLRDQVAEAIPALKIKALEAK